MERVLVAVAIVAVAAVVSGLLRRRAPDPPTQTRRSLPAQVDRADFVRPDAPWLVIVFSSSTCSTCAAVVAKAAVLESDLVAVEEVAYQRDRERHRRYGIDSVPALVVVDASGVVRHGTVGPITATDLWAAVAEARQPGSVRSEGGECLGDR